MHNNVMVGIVIGAVTLKCLPKNRCHFTAVVDTANMLREEYAPRIPTTYIINPEGYIIARINGSKEWDGELAVRLIRNILEQAR